MKKYIGFLTLIASAALLLTACFGTNNGGDANAPKKTAYNKIIVEWGANADVSALESLLSDRSGLYRGVDLCQICRQSTASDESGQR